MDYAWYPCPAKLNLFLHINARLENGYHHLQTYFQLLEACDFLGIKVTLDNQVQLETSLPNVPDAQNLVIRAAELLRQTARNELGIDNLGALFALKKHLPMGGGIGGGSSNAATALVVLNHLWKLHLPLTTLMSLGRTLGADVPVFINGFSGFAQGVGEDITVAELPQRWYLVANPGIHVSTAEVFNDAQLPRNTPLINFDDYSFDKTVNDCQTLVCKRYPKVAKLLQWLVNYAPSRMTGTGACVFAVFEHKQDADAVLRQLPDEFNGFVSRSTARSVLHRQFRFDTP